jgi:hypothetical protein
MPRWKMVNPYEYYKELCSCADIKSPGASDYGAMYDFMHQYCECPPESVYLCMRNLAGEEVSFWPVGVWNVNEQFLGVANNREEYIALWNSNSANKQVGKLSAGIGPFCFTLTLNPGTIPPPWVIGTNGPLDYRIYEFRYDEAYE